MSEPKTRECRYYGDDLTISHYFGEHENYGDTEFSFGPVYQYKGRALERERIDTGKFEIAAFRRTGRDRDNYDSSDDASIELNAEEARELHLLLSIWIEKQNERLTTTDDEGTVTA